VAPKHPDKEIRALLREAEEKGWKITKARRYWKLWCPNECKCFKTVKTTPSDPDYLKNLRGQLNRATCWRQP
jgi:hypothetical protein